MKTWTGSSESQGISLVRRGAGAKGREEEELALSQKKDRKSLAGFRIAIPHRTYKQYTTARHNSILIMIAIMKGVPNALSKLLM